MAFDPNLHVDQRAVGSAWSEFLEGSDASFVVCGAAGFGKTSALIELAQRALADELPFFLSLPETGAQPLEYLAREFGWTFSTERSWPRLLEDLEEIAKDTGHRAIIFVDGFESIDPPRLFGIRSTLGEVAERFSGSSGRLRLVIGCEPRTWEELVDHRGQRTKLGLVGRGTFGAAPNVRLMGLHGPELEVAFERLRAVFGLKGRLERPVSDYCVNPRFLRMLAVAYRDRPIPGRIVASDFVSRYLERVLHRRPDPELATNVLKQLANLLIERSEGVDRDLAWTVDRRVLEDELVGAHSIRELQALLSAGVLEARRVKKSSRETIGLKTQWLQHYVIAFLLLDAEHADADEIRRLLSASASNRCIRFALGWFARLATAEQRAVLLAPVEAGASRYSDVSSASTTLTH